MKNPNVKCQMSNQIPMSNVKFLSLRHLKLIGNWKLEIGILLKRFRMSSALVPHEFSDRKGVALLPVILVLFGLVMVVGIAIAAISVSENTISSTKDASDKAFVIAESGIQDALMKLTRDSSYTVTNGSLSISGGTATINVPSGGFPKNITSAGTINSKTRKIQLTVNADGNGKITQSSWQEVAP